MPSHALTSQCIVHQLSLSIFVTMVPQSLCAWEGESKSLCVKHMTHSDDIILQGSIIYTHLTFIQLYLPTSLDADYKYICSVPRPLYLCCWDPWMTQYCIGSIDFQLGVESQHHMLQRRTCKREDAVVRNLCEVFRMTWFSTTSDTTFNVCSTKTGNIIICLCVSSLFTLFVFGTYMKIESYFFQFMEKNR